MKTFYIKEVSLKGKYIHFIKEDGTAGKTPISFPTKGIAETAFDSYQDHLKKGGKICIAYPEFDAYVLGYSPTQVYLEYEGSGNIPSSFQ